MRANVKRIDGHDALVDGAETGGIVDARLAKQRRQLAGRFDVVEIDLHKGLQLGNGARRVLLVQGDAG